MISKGVKVEAKEAHSRKRMEGVLGFSSNSIAEDEDVMEADTVVEEPAAEGFEEVEDEGFKVGTCEDVENSDERSARVVKPWLPPRPVEEFQTREDVAAGATVPENSEDEALREREGEGGESGGEVVGGGSEDLVDVVEKRVLREVARGEPRLEGGGDVVLSDEERR